MTSTKVSAGSNARIAALALVALVGHLWLGYAHEAVLRSDDDRLYLYYAGAQLGRGAESAPLNSGIQADLRAGGASEDAQWRFASRDEYRGNYLGPTVVYRLAADAVRRVTGELNRVDYPAFLARAMFWGYLSTYLGVSVLLVAIVVMSRDTRALVAVAAAIAAIAVTHAFFHALSWLGLPIQGGQMLLPIAHSPEPWYGLWRNLPALLLNPGPPLTPFGDTPRHHFSLLAIVVFLLRWRGAYTASYGLLLGLSAVHQSYAGLLVSCLLATDAVLRPRVLVWRAGALAAVTLALFAGRETLGDVIGLARPAVLIAAVAAAAAVVVAFWLGVARGATGLAAGPAGAAVAAVRQRLLARGPVAADVVVIGAMWLVSLPVVAAINANSSVLESMYFWRQIHGRSLGFLRPALVLALTLWAICRLERARGERQALLVTVCASALALVPCALFVARQPLRPIASFERGLRRIEAQRPPAINWNGRGGVREGRVYYDLAHALEQRRR